MKLKAPWLIQLSALFLALYGWIFWLTCRVKYVTPVPAAARRPALFALWHGQLMAVPLVCWPGGRRRLVGLMSASRDGQLTQALARYFGIGAVVGSSSKQAVPALRQLMRLARAGTSLFLTPDGPRGPHQVAKGGATEIARVTGLPLVPCAAWIAPGVTLRSWDQFRLGWPFATVWVAYGAPLEDLTPAALTQELQRLTALLQEAADVRAGD